MGSISHMSAGGLLFGEPTLYANSIRVMDATISLCEHFGRFRMFGKLEEGSCFGSHPRVSSSARVHLE